MILEEERIESLDDWDRVRSVNIDRPKKISDQAKKVLAEFRNFIEANSLETYSKIIRKEAVPYYSIILKREGIDYKIVFYISSDTENLARITTTEIKKQAKDR